MIDFEEGKELWSPTCHGRWMSKEYEPGLVSVIIPTYRRWSFLESTVADFNQQTWLPDEIIIVDQSPPADIPQGQPDRLVSASRAKVRYVRQTRPRVYEARNRAAEIAEGEILIYVDDDVRVEAQYVEAHMVNYRDPSVHAVVGAIQPQHPQPTAPVPEGFSTLPPEVQAYLYSERFCQRLERVGFMWAGNFSVRKDVLAAVGGWDEHILTYGDRDLGIRLAKAGYRIDYDPQASLIHVGAKVGGTRLSDESSPWSAWERCVSIHLLAWRHLSQHPLLFLKFGLFRAARFSFLLRRNALRPWRWPVEVIGYTKAFVVARKWAKDGVKCSFPYAKRPIYRSA